MIGEVSSENGRFAVYIDQDTDTLTRLKNFPILISGDKKVLLQDIASIHTGPIDITKRYEYASASGVSSTVFL